ncbi:MAG: aminotransferase class V-fold PLP-dependent enzyme [Rhodobacteraceae bacterium]|nr:aminotransferase class V-fold PLP-dependent enzyme [Paracoccaceae bacterium]
MNIDLEKVRAETPGLQNGTHLMACGSSLMPKPVIDAVINYTLLEGEIGGYEAEAIKQEELDSIYATVAQSIGAQKHEIAILENATVAWMNAFYALPIERGSRILTSEAEYAANYVAFMARAKKDALTIDIVPSNGAGALDLEQLERQIDDRVGLIAITWIPTNGGLVNPAEGVGKIAKKYKIPFLLDGCQAVGQMVVDVKKIGCDFFSATGRKFLRGPRGTGYLYISETWLELMHPVMIDHFGAPWIAREKYLLREDARRFETWENSYALRVGLNCAINYASEIGMEAIQERTWLLAKYCRNLLGEVKGVKLTDLGDQKCGIVSFYIEGCDSVEVVSKLANLNIIIGTSSPPTTLIDSEIRQLPVLLRASPHYYNTHNEIESLVSGIKSIL